MISVDVSHLKRNNLKNKTVSNKLLLNNIEVDFKLSENTQLNNYLIDKSKELLGVQINARLNLGRIFQEVHDKLAGKPQDGLYVKWLEVNGFNKMTALRHRNRYKLYELMPNDHLKFLIASTSQKIVEAYLNDKEKLDILISMDTKINKSELSVLALSSSVDEIVIEKEMQFDIIEEYGNFKNKINHLDISKLSIKQKEQFAKLVENFNKLLKEIS
jgi:hypothetical protein